MEALAADVVDQVPGPVDLLVGHSLGSVVALTMLGLAPDYCTTVVAEDPPGLPGPDSLGNVADGSSDSSRRPGQTRPPPVARLRPRIRAGRSSMPRTRCRTASSSMCERVSTLLRTDPWDLPDLVARCPVPVHLLVATRDSALLEPARTAVLDLLPDDQVEFIDGGHDLHRERPGLWLHVFLELARRYVPVRPTEAP